MLYTVYAKTLIITRKTQHQRMLHDPFSLLWLRICSYAYMNVYSIHRPIDNVPKKKSWRKKGPIELRFCVTICQQYHCELESEWCFCVTFAPKKRRLAEIGVIRRQVFFIVEILAGDLEKFFVHFFKVISFKVHRTIFGRNDCRKCGISHSKGRKRYQFCWRQHNFRIRSFFRSWMNWSQLNIDLTWKCAERRKAAVPNNWRCNWMCVFFFLISHISSWLIFKFLFYMSEIIAAWRMVLWWDGFFFGVSSVFIFWLNSQMSRCIRPIHGV